MLRFQQIVSHRFVLWWLLSLPGIGLLWPILSGQNYFSRFLVETGEWSVRLLMLTLAITPLSLMFKGRNWARFLMRRRRYFGVASFAYAALHVGFYVWDIRSLDRILFVAERFYAWSGWLAMGLMLVLAASSNNHAQRLLAAQWKNLQRLTYGAALFTAIHWVLLARGSGGAAWAQIGLIVGLELVRLYYRVGQWRRGRLKAAV